MKQFIYKSHFIQFVHPQGPLDYSGARFSKLLDLVVSSPLLLGNCS